jgi:methylthioribose-1-phosphate isomerase
MNDARPPIEPVRWCDDAIEYLDQRLLPHRCEYRRATTLEEIVEAITSLAVRGAPCIGVFGAYGVALLRRTLHDERAAARAIAAVRAARPTAVNLAWAVDRVAAALDALAEAQAIHREQLAVDAAIASAAQEIIPKGARILTHCNTGPLATAGYGTALGAVIEAHRLGKHPHVIVDETRPLLQGARLTMWELARAGVPAVLQVDAAAASAMASGEIDLVVVGADRIARNGDTANKIGTYALAVAAAHHGLPFYVAAPRSTFDQTLASGAEIPIEMRDGDEVVVCGGLRTAPPDVRVRNHAFDITPGRLVTAFITEYGIIRPPYEESLESLASRPSLAAIAALRR